MACRDGALAILALLCGCVSVSPTPLPTVTLVEYRLGPGDRLKLEVFREPGLSGEFAINDQGMVGLPLVGEVPAAERTLMQLRGELAAAFARSYVRDARLNLDVASYRPLYILGEVQKPGEYAFVPGMSIQALVAKAGGFSYRANAAVVYVRHAAETDETAYRLASGAAVLPGDTVRIVARHF